MLSTIRRHIPVVYNASGYENTETLRVLEGYVDIYLPDFKYMEAGQPDTIPMRRIIRKRQRPPWRRWSTDGTPVFSEDGMMKKEVIVRHLMLPGQLMDAKQLCNMCMKLTVIGFL